MAAGPRIILEGEHLDRGVVTDVTTTEGKGKEKAEDESAGLTLRKRNRTITIVESNTIATNEQVQSNIVMDLVNGGRAAEGNTATVHTSPASSHENH